MYKILVTESLVYECLFGHTPKVKYEIQMICL